MKGERIRPCYVCKQPVKYVFWHKRDDGVYIDHWANPDGTHHEHAGKAKARPMPRNAERRLFNPRPSERIAATDFSLPPAHDCAVPPWEECGCQSDERSLRMS